MGARQWTLAGDVARACAVPGWCPAWFPVVARHGYELSGGQRAAEGAGRLLGRVWRPGGPRGQAASAGVMVMTQPGLSFWSCRIR